MCNHVSYCDVGVLCWVLGPFAAVAKADIINLPVIGWLANAWGCFFVDRIDRTPEMVERLNQKLKDRANRMGPRYMQPPILIFPEGTTTSGDAVTRFRLGAFRPGLDVLPIALNYKIDTDIGRGWSPPYGGQEHFFRILGTWNKTVEVNLLPLRARAEGESAEEMAVSVQKSMAESIGVPAALEWTLKDAFAFYKVASAWPRRLPSSPSPRTHALTARARSLARSLARCGTRTTARARSARAARGR